MTVQVWKVARRIPQASLLVLIGAAMVAFLRQTSPSSGVRMEGQCGERPIAEVEILSRDADSLRKLNEFGIVSEGDPGQTSIRAVVEEADVLAILRSGIALRVLRRGVEVQARRIVPGLARPTSQSGLALAEAAMPVERRAVEPVPAVLPYPQMPSLSSASSCEGQNYSDVTIPSPEGYPYPGPTWVRSGINISCAPADTIVTTVDLRYIIRHTYIGDLEVRISSQGTRHMVWNHEGGSANDIDEREDGINAFRGKSVNGWWYLEAIDTVSGDQGYVDYWWLRVWYAGSSYQFTGRVIDDNTGAGLADVTVKLHRWQGGQWSEINAGTSSAPDGYYTIWASAQQGKYAVEEINPADYVSVRAVAPEGINATVISPDRVEYDDPAFGVVGPAVFYDAKRPTQTPTPSRTATSTPTRTPAATSTHTPTTAFGGRVQLPLLLRLYPKPAPISGVENGGFEYGLYGWRAGGGLAVDTTGSGPHGGAYAALLGSPRYPCESAPSGEAWLNQRIEVPADGSPLLRVWYRIVTFDRNQALVDIYDRFDVEVAGQRQLRVMKQAGEYGCRLPPEDMGWRIGEIPLSDWRGQEVEIRFLLYADAENNTWVYIDDVSLGSENQR